MARVTSRRVVWSAVGILTVIVVSGSAYLLTYKHPQPRTKEVIDPFDLKGEMRRASALPEFAEIKQINSKENRPLKEGDVTRLGELAQHPNSWIRIMSLGVLGNAREPLREKAAGFASPGLKDGNFFVRVCSMDALARLQAKDRIPELVPFLKSADPDERACARRALQHLGHPVN